MRRGWFLAALLWAALAAASVAPFRAAAEIGRGLLALTVAVHAAEAVVAALRARKAGLSALAWLLRTLALGWFGLSRLSSELDSRRGPD
jgi:apolipoprotein N-acyltransferase